MDIDLQAVFPGAPQRFLDRIHTSDGCWEWQGFIRANGYGEYWKDGRTHLAHRVAYEYAHGEIPKDHEIDHVTTRGCVTRACVNPEHLEAVTHTENMHRQGDAAPSNRAPKNLEQLKEAGKPFRFTDPEVARQAALKSAEVRRAKAQAKQAEAQVELERQQRVTQVLLAPPQDGLAARTREATVQILESLLTGDIPIRNGKEAADLISTLHAVERLEQGLPTSQSVNITSTIDQLKQRLLASPSAAQDAGYAPIDAEEEEAPPPSCE